MGSLLNRRFDRTERAVKILTSGLGLFRPQALWRQRPGLVMGRRQRRRQQQSREGGSQVSWGLNRGELLLLAVPGGEKPRFSAELAFC